MEKDNLMNNLQFAQKMFQLNLKESPVMKSLLAFGELQMHSQGHQQQHGFIDRNKSMHYPTSLHPLD
jgi:hypothetical protein